MSRARTRTGVRRAAAGTSPVAALGAALLAIDNLLGFVGFHVLGPSLVPLVVVISSSAGVAAAVCAALIRDPARLVVAFAGAAFVATLSPATGSNVWLPVAIALQAVVPLGFAAAAVVLLRGRRSTTAVRLLAGVLVPFALAWAMAALTPVDLTMFLAVQAGTLLVAAFIELQPVLTRCTRVARELWLSADVR